MPISAREQGVSLKAYPRMSFHISIKGVIEMNYRIESKGPFEMFGAYGLVNSDPQRGHICVISHCRVTKT